MRTANTVKPFGAPDESLLAEGKYREWFWKGLDPTNVAWLKAPVKTPEPVEPDNYKIDYQNTQVRGWQQKSLCKDADPLIFFSESHDPKADYMKPDAAWRKFCPQCPVRETCLEAARESESVGIWGGKLFFMPTDGTTRVTELDESSMPRRGRPPKAKSLRAMNHEERHKAWQEMQKEIDARISVAAARESLSYK